MQLAKRVSHFVSDQTPCQYTASEVKCKRSPFSLGANPTGYIDISIAENKCMFQELLQKTQQVSAQPSEDFVYAEYWHGKQEMRELVSKFLNERLGYDSNADSVRFFNVAHCLVYALLLILFFYRHFIYLFSDYSWVR